MPYIWPREHIKQNDLVDASQFDRLFNEPKGLVHALDRENLPEACIGDAELADEALTEISLLTDFSMEDLGTLTEDSYAFPTSKGNAVVGCAYGDSIIGNGGSWVLLKSATITHLEGMLALYFHCWQYIQKTNVQRYLDSTYKDSARKCFSYQLRHNGVVVAESGELYGAFENPHLETTIPVATGPGTIEVYFKVPTKLEDAETQVVGFIGGCQLVAEQRRR